MDACPCGCREGLFWRETRARRCSVSRSLASSFSSSVWPVVTSFLLFGGRADQLTSQIIFHPSFFLHTIYGYTYFSSTFWLKVSTLAPPAPPVPAPPALKPNMESRSDAKLWATVLVTRECLLVLGASWEGSEGTYDSEGAEAFPFTLPVED